MNANTASPVCRMIVFRIIFIVVLTALHVACSTKPTGLPKAQVDRAERLNRGCVFFFDGAGGGTAKSNYASGVVKGFLDAGYIGGGEMAAWETDRGLLVDQVASVSYKRDKARALAGQIAKYHAAHPEAPIGILGFSAGCAEAVFALEVLPADVKVDTVVLLGASISHDYDLTRALRRVKGRLNLFTSPHDHMLADAMVLSGTADRKFNDAGAGIRGFVLPAEATASTKQLYAEKIVTIHYADDYRKDGDRGHHFDNVKEAFIRDHVAPLFIGHAHAAR